jgi:catechol 2,3-dioxygenase-like lactoylglutathione lyase family enzyme
MRKVAFRGDLQLDWIHHLKGNDQETTMIKLRRLGHATFTTPDLDKAIDYYAQVNGLLVAEREKNRAFLATKVGQLIVQLELGDQAACTKLSFEIAPSVDFEEARRALANDGIKSELRNDSIPGIGKVLAFKDNKGTTIELFTEWSYLCRHGQALGAAPLKLGHVAFAVQNPQETASFYERVMGFRVSDWIGDFFVFMRCNTDHHSVNFIRGKSTRMHHIAFELKDFSHLQESCDILGQQQIPIIWGPLRHGPGHNIATYHRNQDDQVVEFFCEMDQMFDEELGYFEPRPWHHDQPQRPKVWTPGKTTVWGPDPMKDFHRDRD